RRGRLLDPRRTRAADFAKTDDVIVIVKGAGHSMATTRKNWHATHRAQLTFGQRIADKVAAMMGSWSFIIVQSVILTVWIILNVIAWISHWDPYPFILLNLALSFQAAYAAPFIMISQNRQAERDRHQAKRISEPMSKPNNELKNCRG